MGGPETFFGISALLILKCLTAAEASNGTVFINSVGPLIPAVFTPYHADLSVNYSMIFTYAKYLKQMNLTTLLVGGTTGEHMSLTMEERFSVLAEWMAAASEFGLQVIAQVGGGPLKDVIALTRHAEKLGVHAILTLPELYYRPKTVDDLVDYVSLVAKEAPNTPILYYHHPSKSSVNFPMPQFVTKASERIPNFRGLKFASPDLTEAHETLRILPWGYELLLAQDAVLAGASALSFKYSCMGSYNIFPKKFQQIVAALADNDVALAGRIQNDMSTVLSIIAKEGRFAALKASMQIVTGLDMGLPRPPNKPLSNEANKRLTNVYRQYGLI